MRSLLPALVIASAASSLGGCFWLLVGGGGAEAGYVAGQKDRTAGETMSDQWILTKVKSGLVASKAKARNINVDVLKGVVTLRGFVGSSEERKAALEAARGVKGVSRVVDKLQVGE